MNGESITVLGETNFRGQKRKFGIKPDDRRRHVYVIGKTGVGKTELLVNMAVQDIRNGHGLAFIDPHGEAVQRLLDFVPSERINDVIYINPADIKYPIAFNVMENIVPEFRHLVASGIMGVFKKIWPDVWSARMEYILNNTILALLETPGTTLLGINRMLADRDYREKIIERVNDPSVKSFWNNEFARYPDRFREEAVAPIQNKVGQFISNSLIRNIIGQSVSSIDMREAMDARKIVLVNLSKGKIGEDNSQLLGALIITKLQLAAMGRVDIPESERKDFYMYVDEFQNFATESFTNILSEARKYRLSLILAHQYITQMVEEVRDAVFGNIGTLMVFRVGAADAEFLEKEFIPEFEIQDLVNLDKYNVYIKLMIDGMTSRAFSSVTMPPTSLPSQIDTEKIIRVSRERYSNSQEIVEEKISRWSEQIKPNQSRDAFKKEGNRKPPLFQKQTKLETIPKVRETSLPVMSLKELVAKKRAGGLVSNKVRNERDTSGLKSALEQVLGKGYKEKPATSDQKPGTSDQAPPHHPPAGGTTGQVGASNQKQNSNKSGVLKPGESVKFSDEDRG